MACRAWASTTLESSSAGSVVADGAAGAGAAGVGVVAGVAGVAGTIGAGATVNDAALSANVTKQGNTFNGVSQLLQLDGSGKLPAVDGSALTGLTNTQVGLSNVTNNAQINKFFKKI